MTKISAFINKISRIPSPPNANNIYSNKHSLNRIRRNNLKIYLEKMSILKPITILVGEAPGYQGCRLSGIPFTSEYIILNGLPGCEIFGNRIGYAKSVEFDRIKKEPSATIVWNTLINYHPLPLIWSAYPFHPHNPGNLNSNRKPRKDEMEIGLPILEEIINLFTIKELIAIGNAAAEQLSRLNLNFVKVRHPSHGGKPEFVKGINNILKPKRIVKIV